MRRHAFVICVKQNYRSATNYVKFDGINFNNRLRQQDCGRPLLDTLCRDRSDKLDLIKISLRESHKRDHFSRRRFNWWSLVCIFCKIFGICVFHVSFLSNCNPRYFISRKWVYMEYWARNGCTVLLHVRVPCKVKVTCRDFCSWT